MDVHHVGLATRDAGGLAEMYGDLVGATVAHRETLDDLELVYLAVGDAYLELLEPTGDGDVAAFLERRGGGVHHLAFATDDVRAALDRARAAGVEVIDEDPRPGGWGHQVAFLHPASTGGVLVEFVEG